MSLRLVSGVALLLVASCLMLLAHDIGHIHTAIRSGDLRASVRNVSPGTWEADTTLPFGAAAWLLGSDDDVALRSLLTVATDTVTGRPTFDQQTRQIPIEVALARLEQGSDAKRASLAAGLLGLLEYERPRDNNRETPEQRAEREFTNAVLLDPTNATAKTNLEVLLQAQRNSRRRGRASVTGGDLAGKAGVGRMPPGHGY
jgi:hypothetical protein